MKDHIFGRSWDEIQDMQQKRGTRVLTPGSKPEATPEDIELLKTLGVEELEEMKFYGVLDRLRTSNLI